MAEIDSSLMLEHFKRIHEELALLRNGQDILIQRMDAMAAHQAGFHASETAQDMSISEIRTRLDRIERRLDLRDQP